MTVDSSPLRVIGKQTRPQVCLTSEFTPIGITEIRRFLLARRVCLDSSCVGLWGFVAISFITLGCGSGRTELMTASQADAVSLTLSTEGGDPAAVDIYFDVSGSMRGFALAAAANDRSAAPEYFSFLNALRSLPTQVARPARPGAAPAAEATEPPGHAATFGAVVDAPIGLD